MEKDLSPGLDRIEEKITKEVKNLWDIILQLKGENSTIQQKLDGQFYLMAERVDSLRKNMEKIEKRLDDGDTDFKSINMVLTATIESLKTFEATGKKIQDIIQDTIRQDERIKNFEEKFKEHRIEHKEEMQDYKQSSKDKISRLISVVSIAISVILSILSLLIKK